MARLDFLRLALRLGLAACGISGIASITFAVRLLIECPIPPAFTALAAMIPNSKATVALSFGFAAIKAERALSQLVRR